MPSITSLCDNFASILSGTVLRAEGDTCAVGVDRTDVNATIMRVPITPSHSFTIRRVPRELPLVIGDMVLLGSEVPFVLHELLDNDIVVSAVHNHWLFDRPRLMYVHVEARMDPIKFARIIAGIIAGMKSHRLIEKEQCLE